MTEYGQYFHEQLFTHLQDGLHGAGRDVVVMDAVGWVDHGLLDGKNRIVFPQLVDGSWMCWSNSTWVLIHVVLQAIKACVG